MEWERRGDMKKGIENVENGLKLYMFDGKKNESMVNWQRKETLSR